MPDNQLHRSFAEVLDWLYFAGVKVKKVFRSYGTFSRKERIGIAALSLLLVALIVVRLSMSYWAGPQPAKEIEVRIRSAQAVYKRSQPEKEKEKDYLDAQAVDMDVPDIINLNSVDSATLVLLKGIGPATAHKIIEYRNQSGAFTDVNQIRSLGRFSTETFELLKPHLTVATE